jgi:PRC-barrel domain
MSESSPSRDYMQSGAQAEDPYLSRIQQRNKEGENRYGFGGEDTYSEQVRHYYRKGAEVLKQQVEETPVLPLLIGGVIAFAAGWIGRGSLDGRGLAIGRSAHQRRHIGARSGNPLIESDRVEGTAVYDFNGQQIGTIRRLMIEKVGGRVIYAIMEFGGLLGIGTDEYAVPWSKLEYDTTLAGYMTDITHEQLKHAPEFSRNQDYDLSDPQSQRDLHDYYEVTYYWLTP